MSAKHTPGPWMFRRVYANGAGNIVAADGRGVACISAAIRRDENEANGRLIAAAPDLYEALLDLHEASAEAMSSDPDMPSHGETLRRFESVMDRAAAALAKAEGRP